MQEKVNQEIRNYTEKVWWGLTWRQLLLIGSGALCVLLVYISLGTTVSQYALSWIIALISSPFLLLALFEWHDMPAEKAALIWIKYFLSRKQLVYRSVNNTLTYFMPLLERLRKEDFDDGAEHPEDDSDEP